MAIVARELAKQPETADRQNSERGRLESFLGNSDAASPDLWRTLARRIRQGEFDPGQTGREQVFDLLQSAAREDVEVCNPAYLAPPAG